MKSILFMFMIFLFIFVLYSIFSILRMDILVEKQEANLRCLMTKRRAYTSMLLYVYIVIFSLLIMNFTIQNNSMDSGLEYLRDSVQEELKHHINHQRNALKSIAWEINWYQEHRHVRKELLTDDVMEFWKTMAVERTIPDLTSIARFADYLSTLLLLGRDFGGFSDFSNVFIVLDGSILNEYIGWHQDSNWEHTTWTFMMDLLRAEEHDDLKLNFGYSVLFDSPCFIKHEYNLVNKSINPDFWEGCIDQDSILNEDWYQSHKNGYKFVVRNVHHCSADMLCISFSRAVFDDNGHPEIIFGYSIALPVIAEHLENLILCNHLPSNFSLCQDGTIGFTADWVQSWIMEAETFLMLGSSKGLYMEDLNAEYELELLVSVNPISITHKNVEASAKYIYNTGVLFEGWQNLTDP